MLAVCFTCWGGHHRPLAGSKSFPDVCFPEAMCRQIAASTGAYQSLRPLASLGTNHPLMLNPEFDITKALPYSNTLLNGNALEIGYAASRSSN